MPTRSPRVEVSWWRRGRISACWGICAARIFLRWEKFRRTAHSRPARDTYRDEQLKGRSRNGGPRRRPRWADLRLGPCQPRRPDHGARGRRPFGGLAKTVEFGDYRFDLGGHRFYTKIGPVERLWEEMLGDELLTRRRMSRIYFGERFFNYPLQAEDVVRASG